MSIAIPAMGGPQVRTPANHGFSDAAQRVRSLLDDVLSSQTSVALGERYRALAEAYNDSLVPNWDGYGAKPTDRSTFARASAFLRALPTAILDPEIGVDPGGQITFEWYRGPRRVFTISIGGDGDLSYAMLFGRDKTYGSAYFVEEIPRPVAFLLAHFLGRKG